MSYTNLPIETSAEELTRNALVNLMALISGWEPRESHLEVLAIEEHAQMNAVTAQVAATVPPEIFRWVGKTLFGIQSIDEARATVPTTWTLLDNKGYTITAGTLVGYQVSGDELIPFRVVADVVVAPGSTATSAGEVLLEAVNPGIEANGHAAGMMYLITALSWVSSIVSTATTAGGVDAETDEEYLDRLAEELRLLSPRPILADDFAVLARRVAGVGRSTAIDGYDPGTNEIQRITTTGSPTGGTFTLTYSGQTTGSLNHDATATAVQSALVALSNIGTDDVVVTGGPLPAPIFVEFTGALAVTNVTQMTKTDSLTGGTSPATVITTTQGGVVPSTDNERIITVAIAAEDGTALDEPTREEVAAYLESLREINFVVNVIDPTYTTVSVTASVTKLAGYDAATVEALCETALEDYLSPDTWDWAGTVYRNELIALLDRVEGVDRVVSISSPASDLTLTGVAALPLAGTMTVSVS